MSLSIDKDEFLAIIGPSGSGKSTLLNMMGLLDRPTSGSIHIDGKDVSKMSEDECTIFRRRNIGFVFQNYNLISGISFYDNITLPLKLDKKAVDKSYLEHIVKILGLSEKLDDIPEHLSGGQQQRVAIARALISKPSIILADEPTGNLDEDMSDDVINLLKKTSQEFSQTIVIITHSKKIAAMADRTIKIHNGKIV